MKPIASTTGTVINEVFGRAYERGDRPALIDLHGGLVYGYRKLVTEVTRAASGLVRRGARRDQVVGVYAATACAQTLAVHTVLAAGGVAAPIPADLPAEGAAELLSSCDARMLIATHDLADAAVAAADFSRVRQVITFGQAPAASDFRDLLTLEPTALPALDPVRQDALVLAGGERVTHTGLLARMAVLDERVRLTESDVVLATWAPDGGCDLVALIALAIARGALLVAANGLPAADLPGTRHDFGVTVLTAEPGTLERITPTHTPSPA